MKKYNPFIIILASLLPVFILGAIISFLKFKNILKEFKAEESRILSLLKERDELKGKIEYFSSNVNIEKEARKRFNAIKEGEVAVIFLFQSPSPSPKLEKEEENIEGESFFVIYFNKISGWIKNIFAGVVQW
jgi:cell division protein FtsB